MVAQHRAHLHVDAALDPVVGRRQGPVNRQLGVEERERDAPSDQPQQAVARRHEPLAGPLPRAVVRRRALGGEALPAAAPLLERGEPRRGGVGVARSEERLGDAVGLDARLQVGPRRRLLCLVKWF